MTIYHYINGLDIYIELVKVKLYKSFKIEMRNELFNLEKGVNKIPMYLAVFLIGIKSANII